MPPIPKSGDLRSDAFLAFVRRRDCFFCGASGPSEAHHWPLRARGTTRDDRTIPVCPSCHKRCHGLTVEDREPISAQAQDQAVDAVRSLFYELARLDELEAHHAALKRWRAARVFEVTI